VTGWFLTRAFAAGKLDESQVGRFFSITSREGILSCSFLIC
jgi:hypothetical protein